MSGCLQFLKCVFNYIYFIKCYVAVYILISCINAVNYIESMEWY